MTRHRCMCAVKFLCAVKFPEAMRTFYMCSTPPAFLNAWRSTVMQFASEYAPLQNST